MIDQLATVGLFDGFPDISLELLIFLQNSGFLFGCELHFHGTEHQGLTVPKKSWNSAPANESSSPPCVA
jgi:hypothetical protein